jgi:phosphoribosylamine--glycine ligase/phosphoribosylaminoimidazole synthetase
MNILILGNGSREQVIREKLESSVKNIYIENLLINEIVSFCESYKIDYVIPSTEQYLCDGVTDLIQSKIPGVQVFGPTAALSQLEGSKKYSKMMMKQHKIPTSNYIYFTDKNKCIQYINDNNINPEEVVLKYSGLAKGKGVYLSTKESIINDINQVFALGDDGVIMEERLYGTEVSVLAFCNGHESYLMPQSQDYKRKEDGNFGANTGGMGAICPVNTLNEQELGRIKKYLDILVSSLKYVGVLYAGVMKTKYGIYILEFNCRFGDPEAQVILNQLETPLFTIINDCILRKPLTIKWAENKYSACVVLSVNQYPYSGIKKTEVVYGSDFDYNKVKVYDGSIFTINCQNYTKGGRVLSLVSTSNSLYQSLINVYNQATRIHYEHKYYRRDIGIDYLIVGKSAKKYKSMGIMASGNGTCLEYIFDNENMRNSIKIIVTNKYSANIINKAEMWNIPVYIIPNKNIDYHKMVNILRIYEIDVLILAGYMRIIPETIYEEFFTVNIHPSLLPDYKGLMDLDVHSAVLEDKKKYSGCTIHEVCGKVDSGRILLQKQAHIDGLNTNTELKIAVQELEKQAIYEFIELYNINVIERYEVDIKEANAFVDDIKRKIPGIGGFCGMYPLNEKVTLVGSADGVGTKLDLAIKYNMLDSVGIDLVAMNVNDIIAGGGIPLFFMDYIAIDKMSKLVCNEILDGIVAGCNMANIELLGGETAEMKGIYYKNKLDLAGFCVGILNKRLPLKNEMKDGNYLYGIHSNGIHSNGYTLVRRLLKDFPSDYSEEFMRPTRIYNEVIGMINNPKYGILGIAHIPGGGFNDNISRVIAEDLKIELYHWEFPSIFKWIQTKSGMSRQEMLDTFNCGYGMVLITDCEINDIEGIDLIGKLVTI